MAHKDHFNSAEYMSVPEAARYLGLGRKVIYQLLDNGDLGFTREHGAIRIWTASVVAFHEGNRLT